MERDIKLFSFSVSSWPKWAILLVGSAGIFLSFLVQGIAQETIYTKYNFKESLFFTFIQFFGYFLFSSGYIIKLIQKKDHLHSSIKFYSLTSFCLCLSMGLSNLSVERLSYPTAVLFKSSKMVPVMIGSMIFLKKKYNYLEIISVFLIAIGLVGISYSDKLSKNRFNISGVILAICSLIADAFASNMQERSLSQNGASQNEVISMMYMIGSVFTFLAALISGQLNRGIQCCIENPSIIIYLLCFAFLGAIGVQFVYLLMKVFDSLVTVMVTSTRKGMTVCLSFILFPTKKFTLYHFSSIILVVIGIFMNYVGKTKKSKENNKSNTHNNTVSENHPGEKTPFLSRRHNKNLIDDSESNAVKQTAVKGS
ncbi:hypothetical protein M9Y10_004267 [Tritrichomonas musculus]|uniref:Adenosine 3'-phospho 5'-phosphosulfate transporter 2 n=1 Tax=Tritrichomonas musculus TaxID=1915356 RepID=A0ABR2JSX3_9EUKA